MTTSAEQEAERRYWYSPEFDHEGQYEREATLSRRAFAKGAEWAESRHRELLEAAREYRATP